MSNWSACHGTSGRKPEKHHLRYKKIDGYKRKRSRIEEHSKFLPYTIVKSTHNRLMVKVSAFSRDHYFHPEEISALLLINLKRDAEKQLGKPVKNAVITVPEHFNASQRNATICAGQLADLNVLGLLNEPTVAALSFGITPRENEYKNILIFDMGGGTFDVTVLGLGENVIEVKKTDGNRYLDGEDFVNSLMNYCLDDIKKKSLIKISTLEKIWNQCRFFAPNVKIVNVHYPSASKKRSI